jgi:hypothetical protein
VPDAVLRFQECILHLAYVHRCWPAACRGVYVRRMYGSVPSHVLAALHIFTIAVLSRADTFLSIRLARGGSTQVHRTARPGLHWSTSLCVPPDRVRCLSDVLSHRSLCLYKRARRIMTVMEGQTNHSPSPRLGEPVQMHWSTKNFTVTSTEHQIRPQDGRYCLNQDELRDPSS